MFEKPTKMYIRRGRCKSIPQGFMLNTTARVHLEDIRRQYSDLLYRDVSASLIVRRALMLLNERLGEMQGSELQTEELAALARVLPTT